MYHTSNLNLDIGHREKGHKDKVTKRWRWVWLVSLLASISCLAGLSAVSPAFTSTEALPCQLAWRSVALALAATSREAETGHIRQASRTYTSLHFTLSHSYTDTQTHRQAHTHRHIRLCPIYTYANGWLHSDTEADGQACIFTETLTLASICRECVCVVF